jgi:hypothetical protein
MVRSWFEQLCVLVAHRHGVNHDLRAFGRDQHDHLKQVACGVRTDEQPTAGVLSSVFDRERKSIAWTMSRSATPCLRAES